MSRPVENVHSGYQSSIKYIMASRNIHTHQQILFNEFNIFSTLKDDLKWKCVCVPQKTCEESLTKGNCYTLLLAGAPHFLRASIPAISVIVYSFLATDHELAHERVKPWVRCWLHRIHCLCLSRQSGDFLGSNEPLHIQRPGTEKSVVYFQHLKPSLWKDPNAEYSWLI